MKRTRKNNGQYSPSGLGRVLSVRLPVDLELQFEALLKERGLTRTDGLRAAIALWVDSLELGSVQEIRP